MNSLKDILAGNNVTSTEKIFLSDDGIEDLETPFVSFKNTDLIFVCLQHKWHGLVCTPYWKVLYLYGTEICVSLLLLRCPF